MSTERIPTAHFIDLNFPQWHPNALPQHLAEQSLGALALPEYIDGFEGLELAHFDQHLTNSLIAVHNPHNDYHGWMHGARFVENASSAYDALATQQRIYIPAGFLQPALIGAARHDEGHPGATFFIDADPDRLPPGASVEQTVESYSAAAASRATAEAGGTTSQQVVAAYGPISTTYGAHEHRGAQLGIARATNPKGISGLINRASDVVPAGGDYAASVVEDQGVLYGERRPAGKQSPVTFEQYCAERQGFLEGYVLPTFDKLDRAVGFGLTAYLGWRKRAHTRLAQTESMLRGTDTVVRSITLSRLSAQYGIEL